jgi:hypothetical protein
MARATRDMPSTRKNAMVFRRLAIRMDLSLDCTAEKRVHARQLRSERRIGIEEEGLVKNKPWFAAAA